MTIYDENTHKFTTKNNIDHDILNVFDNYYFAKLMLS